MSLFRCPLCQSPLTHASGEYLCGSGHRFDVAKEGYVNLLPANQMHSKAPGDDKNMVAARTRFLEGSWYEPLKNKLCDLVEERAPAAPALLDAGCGEGYYTAALARVVAAKGGRLAGVDLSKPSVKRAAKRCPAGEFAVASVYRLPMADEAADVLVNCFSPLALEEFGRVLRPGGTYLYVVPGPRHLWELKRALYETPYPNPEETVDYGGLRCEEVVPVETSMEIRDNQTLRDLFQMTPYAWKTPKSGVERLAALEDLTVTAQFRVHVFRKEFA